MDEVAALLTRPARLLRAGALAALLAATRLAWGHAFLARADPRVGSTVSVAPAHLTLVYTEGVEPAFSHVEVVDDAGRRVASGPLEHPASDTISIALPALEPGRYTVSWSVVSVDTHPTEGHFTFSVKAP